MCLHYKLVSSEITLKTDIKDVKTLDELLDQMDEGAVERLRRLITDDEINECAICLQA